MRLKKQKKNKKVVPFIEEDHRVLKGSTGAVHQEVSAPGRKSTPHRLPSWLEPSGENGHSHSCERRLSHYHSDSHVAWFQEYRPHPDHKPVLPKVKKNIKYRITKIIRCTLFMAQTLVWIAGKESCQRMGKCIWGRQMNEIARGAPSRDHTNREQPGCFPLHCGCIHTLRCTVGLCNISSLAKLYLKVIFTRSHWYQNLRYSVGDYMCLLVCMCQWGRGYFGLSVQLSWVLHPIQIPSWKSCFTVKDRVVCH